MRKMPAIPRDVFFGEPAAAPEPAAPATEPAPEPAPEPVIPPATVAVQPPLAAVTPPVAVAAVPVPVVEEDKIQVTIYLTPPIAKRLEALRFHLLNDYNVKVSKSALTEYAITQLGADMESLARALALGER